MLDPKTEKGLLKAQQEMGQLMPPQNSLTGKFLTKYNVK